MSFEWLLVGFDLCVDYSVIYSVVYCWEQRPYKFLLDTFFHVTITGNLSNYLLQIFEVYSIFDKSSVYAHLDVCQFDTIWVFEANL